MLLAPLLLLAQAPPVVGEEGDPEPSDPPEAVPLEVGPRLVPLDAPWRPPELDEKRRDWLVLTSGEWLSGDIDLINDEVVYFDSKELDDLEIDWDDVAQLRSARANTYRFGPGTDGIVTGTAAMRDGVIRVDTGEQVVEFPRDELVSMIEGELRELNYWSLDASIGVTLRAGNSEQTDMSGRLQIERETVLTRLLLSYETNYSVVEREEITNNQRVQGEFSVYVSNRFFVTAPQAEVYRDRLQNIDLRATVGAGVGYDVVESRRIDWSLMLGAGYQYTDFDQATGGEEDPSDDFAILVGTRLELDPVSDVDWDTDYSLQAVPTDPDKTNHHLISVISVDVWGPIDFDLSFGWDRIEGPVTDDSGDTPKKNDFRLTAGLAIDL